ncbi:hypothetical protein GCM10010123_39250 [Pilimelia anulata]|uniref:TIGR03089 family protein n=1 Tax=Pilimelia anulata TaxID=53371 RepID=A0A8J3FFM2_9ACTN|nr:TIGR03089 family protein [Pilimelia anulata]GGK05520.1 hypothetical protein GCM10010123_39250 [Pilimelia anulata]
MKSPESVDLLFGRVLAGDPALPVLTWYDDATGERVELSGTTLDNWRAKTANLLVDECGLGAGDRAAVALPPHWQTAAVLLGCWSAGLAVGGPGADVIFGTPATAPDAEPAAPDRYVLGLAPLGLPMRAVPAGLTDYVAAVRQQGDHFAGPPVDPAAPALDGADHAATCAAARERAAALGIAAGARVLVDAARYPDPRDWLLAPLAAGASVVLCAGPVADDGGRRAAAERVTHRLP